MRKPSHESLAAVILFATCLPAFGQEIPPKPLVDFAAAGSEQKFTPSSPAVHVTKGEANGLPAFDVSIDADSDAYPGVKIVPSNPAVFDLSSYGHVESKITNTGSDVLIMNLRVDNAGPSTDRPFNTELVKIAAGKTITITVFFGFQYGGSLGYPLKPEAVNAVLLFTGKTGKPQSFRIESLQAGGPPGEKPASSIKTARIKPKNGILLGESVTIDAAKQIEAKAGAKGAVDGKSLVVTFPKTPTAAQSAAYKPAAGRWHLGDASEVHVKVTNIGSAAVTPTVQLDSDVDSTAAIIGGELAPGASEEIIIPFAAAVSWRGLPVAERRPNHDTVPGTGTQFASDKSNAVRITAKYAGGAEAQLKIDSITAVSTTMEVADWVGKRPPADGEWEKTFDDEFDGPSLDTTKWNNFGANYWDKVSHWSKDNVILGDGTVRIRSERKLGFQNDDPKGKQTNQASGFLDTFDKFRQRYGYFEARMKLPTAPGLWPAFWLMPDRGPNTPEASPGSKAKRGETGNGGMEFDVMEHLAIWGPHRFNIAMHWDNYGPDHKATGTGKVYVQPDKDGFITSGLLWLPGQAIYYCNGQEVARWEDPRISNVPSLMMFTLPLGGWDGNVADGTGFPDDFVIDYVRVWQRADLKNDPNGPPPTLAAPTK